MWEGLAFADSGTREFRLLTVVARAVGRKAIDHIKIKVETGFNRRINLYSKWRCFIVMPIIEQRLFQKRKRGVAIYFSFNEIGTEAFENRQHSCDSSNKFSLCNI